MMMKIRVEAESDVGVQLQPPNDLTHLLYHFLRPVSLVDCSLSEVEGKTIRT